jgi:hypothetical protein
MLPKRSKKWRLSKTSQEIRSRSIPLIMRGWRPPGASVLGFRGMSPIYSDPFHLSIYNFMDLPQLQVSSPNYSCLKHLPGIRTLPMAGALRFQNDISIHGQGDSFADC